MNWQTLCDPMFSGRLCMTLVHSLWQVTLFAAVAWALDRLGRRRSVRASYAVHVAALLAGLAAMPVTYALVDVAAPGAVAQSEPTVDVVAPETPPVLVKSEVPRSLADLPEQGPTAGSQPPGRDAVASAAVATVVEDPSARWPRVAPWIAAAYALGVVLMLVRLLRAMWHAHRLAARAEPIADGPLAERLRTLAHGWSMRVVPVLARAEEIVVPKVVGLLRPAILLPVSAIAGLSPDELEMILAHELAHVRRHDMWVNLAQRLAEVVLFFNPALWYLSRRVSTLREYCCDELTCRATSGSDAQLRARYASALLRIVELSKPAGVPRRRQPHPVETGDLAALAAASRSPSDLRRRVARLFGEPLPEPVRLSRGGMVAVLIAVAVLLATPAAWRTAARSEPAVAPNAEEPQIDTAKAQAGQLAIDLTILGVDGKLTVESCHVTVWKDVTAASEAERGEDPWIDRQSGTVWRAILKISGGHIQTSRGKIFSWPTHRLQPGVYRLTALVGCPKAKMTGIAVSGPIRLDGSQKTTPVTISVEDGPAVTFTVLDAETGKPIDSRRPGINLTRSDGLGVTHFAFEHLAPGSYPVDVSARAGSYGDLDYLPEKPIHVDVRAGKPNAFVVKLRAQPVDEAEAKKRWPWAVEGTVGDEQGRPLKDVAIHVTSGMVTLHPTKPVFTDARGHYLLRFGPGFYMWDEETARMRASVQFAHVFAQKPGYAEKNLGRQGDLRMADEMPKDASHPDRERIILPGKPRRVDFTMVPGAADEAEPAAKQVDLAVVVARHALLLDGKEIITWEQLEKRIAALPDPSLALPTFYTTRGAHEAGLYPATKMNIWRLHQRFKLKGHSEASLSPSADLRYDAIKTAADLVPDASLRVEGRVVDGKGEPVADAEVLLVTPVDESIPYKSHNIVLVEGRVRNPLEHVMTRSDAKGQFAVYPPKDVNFYGVKYYVVALHPTAGFNLAPRKPLSDGGKVQLLPWATLTSRFEEVAGERQEASLGTQVREQNGLPEIIFNQYWSDQGRKSPTHEFRFTCVPPIFPTTLDRDFPSEQGGSIGLPGATVSLLPGESRRLDLGPLSDKQREQLQWMRKKSAQQRENRPVEPKPAPSPATDGGKQAEPPVNDPAGKPAAKDAALDAEKRESAQLAIDVSILGVDGKPIDQHSVVTIWERVKVAADVGARDHGWTDPRDGTIWRRVCGSISGETGPTRNGKDRFLTRNPLPPGVYRVTAFVGSRNEKMTGMAVSEPVRLDGSRKTTPVAISIENGPPATFTVLDAKTEKPIDYPRPGIRLTRSDGLVVEWDPLNPNLFPGNDGKYRIEHLSPGSYRVDVSARTYAYGYSDYAQEKPMAIDIREGEANEVVAKLHAQPLDEAEAKKRWPWAVEGTVADDEGRPLEGVEIRAATGYGTLRSTLPVVTDARGRYLLRFGPGMMMWNEKTGKWGADVQCASIFADKTGYAEKNLGRQGGLLMADEMPDDKSDWDRKKIILPDKPYHLDFTMLPAATIQGRLVDEKGEPLAKTGVLLNGTALPPSSSIAGSATTDAEGRFRFDRVTPGFAWWLELGDVKDLASSRTQPITLERGETYDVDLRIVSQEGAGKMPRIVGIKDARGRDVLDKVIGDE